MRVIDALNATLERRAEEVENLREALDAERKLSQHLHLVLAQQAVQKHSWFE